LKARSAARVAADPEFHYVLEDLERLRKKLDDNRISLNEDIRRHEVDEQKARKEERSKERLARKEEEPSIYRVTLETIDAPKLELIMYPGKIAEAKNKGNMKVAPEAAPDADDDADPDGDLTGDDNKAAAIDPERDETLNILGDLVRLSAGPKTASTAR
ncbi:MAG TPA: carboxy terminal-processing peptidase, partial [Chthoniobacterales bacterium]